jgi:hypothetical protein
MVYFELDAFSRLRRRGAPLCCAREFTRLPLSVSDSWDPFFTTPKLSTYFEGIAVVAKGLFFSINSGGNKFSKLQSCSAVVH